MVNKLNDKSSSKKKKKYWKLSDVNLTMVVAGFVFIALIVSEKYTCLYSEKIQGFGIAGWLIVIIYALAYDNFRKKKG